MLVFGTWAMLLVVEMRDLRKNEWRKGNFDLPLSNIIFKNSELPMLRYLDFCSFLSFINVKGAWCFGQKAQIKWMN